jgi:hypothetical protein
MELGQTTIGPAIGAVEPMIGTTAVTVSGHVLPHPVTTREIVPTGPAPQLTQMLFVFDGPMIEPPVTVHV